MEFAPFGISLQELSAHNTLITITIAQDLVDSIFDSILHAKQQVLEVTGFDPGCVPLSYVKDHYHAYLLKTSHTILLHYVVLSYLYNVLRKNNIIIAQKPVLKNISLNDQKNSMFVFEVGNWKPINLYNWKAFPFKAPKRKNYKDIDRQVQGFIKDEEDRYAMSQHDVIYPGDWVGFEINLIDNHNNNVVQNHYQHRWLRIGEEDIDASFGAWFIGKKIGDTFKSNDVCFQHCFHQAYDSPYYFNITILYIAPQSYFSFNDFKNYFKITSKKELHTKLIEVFSFRNDISQRRATMEEALKLLVNKHSFSVPKIFIDQQKEKVLSNVRANPDYQVYKTNSAFNDQVRKLAEKQIKEELLIDQIAYSENIDVSAEDIKCYLNFTQRPRMRDYLYFTPPTSKVLGQEIPINSEVLSMHCRREKTLNYIINHYTRLKSL